jgi:hypothetical protein
VIAARIAIGFRRITHAHMVLPSKAPGAIFAEKIAKG